MDSEPCARLVLCYNRISHPHVLFVQLLFQPPSDCCCGELAGGVKADVLANTTSVGMQPSVGESPVQAQILEGYELVFDAVYTPLKTQLLKVRRVHNCLVTWAFEARAS